MIFGPVIVCSCKLDRSINKVKEWNEAIPDRDCRDCETRNHSGVRLTGMNQSLQITDVVKESARDAGFELAGIAPVHEFDELDHFPEWIAAGRAGEMKYMEARDESGALKRASLRSTLPWVRSVIVCAINYNTAQPYSTQVDDPQRGWISRYAWGKEDYHDAVMNRLRIVESKLRDAAGQSQDCRIANPLLRGHRPAGRTGLCQVCGHRLDRQEHLHHQSEAGVVAVSGRDPDFA